MTRFELLAIRDTPQEDAVRALQDLYTSRGYGPPSAGGIVDGDALESFEVSPQRQRWIVVFPAIPGNHADDAAAISRDLRADVLHLRAEVGQEIAAEVWASGERRGSHPGEPSAIAALARSPEGQDEARRILSGRTEWQDYVRLADALGIPGAKDFELMNDALMDQEEAGYRHLVLRKAAPFGLLKKVRRMFAKPDLAPRKG